MNRLSLPVALCALALLTAVAAAQGDVKDKDKAQKPNVDLVICLDTSNSMDGLIESAKVKLWDIVNELAKARPTPTLRIALYAYGSPAYGAESGWVRKELDFTTDLDTVYQKLFALRTNGGDEYVARVSQAALDQLDWSKDAKALKLIFVCGNEPANQDPTIKLEDVAKKAVQRGVYINTIHCKYTNNDADAQTWQHLAALAEGRFVSIDQNRGAVAISSPVDKKLAELGEQMNKTYVWYGKQGEARQQNQAIQDLNAAKLGAGVYAERAAAKNSTFYRMAEACLVDKVLEDPNFDITKVEEKDLPENLKQMKPAERVEYVNSMKAKRVELQKQITELSRQRDDYVREQLQKQQGGAEQAFDQALRGVLQIQAQKKNIEIPK